MPHRPAHTPSIDHPVDAAPVRRPSIARACAAANGRLVSFEGPIHAWVVRHSVAALRVALGVVFLGFGLLKYFPEVSPA